MFKTIHLEYPFTSQRYTLDADNQAAYNERVLNAKRALVTDAWLEPLLTAKSDADFEALQKAIPDTGRYLRFNLMLHDCAMAAWCNLPVDTSPIWAEIIEKGT